MDKSFMSEISLAKISYLDLIPRLKIDVVIPDEVYREAAIRGGKG